MKVILFGGTGMVGQGVLRECLLDPAVEAVLSVGRNRLKVSDAGIRELIQPDLFDFSDLESELSGYECMFFHFGRIGSGPD